MLITAYSVSVFFIILLPIGFVIYLMRRFNLGWKLPVAGALTFILSQVLHIPLLTLLKPSPTWSVLVTAILLGLLAGIFEETARYILYKFVLKQANTWREGVLVGAGHGGIEAILIGFSIIATIATMIAMKDAADLSAFNIPADQIEAVKQQVATFWTTPPYVAFLALLERAFAMCLHISLSVMVLYSVTYQKPIWFWVALFWHAVADSVPVFFRTTLGAVGLEAIVGISALISLFILFRMKPLFAQEAPLTQAHPSSN